MFADFWGTQSCDYWDSEKNSTCLGTAAKESSLGESRTGLKRPGNEKKKGIVPGSSSEQGISHERRNGEDDKAIRDTEAEGCRRRKDEKKKKMVTDGPDDHTVESKETTARTWKGCLGGSIKAWVNCRLRNREKNSAGTPRALGIGERGQTPSHFFRNPLGEHEKRRK